MNLPSAMVSLFFFLAQTRSAASAATAKKTSRTVSLRGRLSEGPSALAQLDPGWWKVTTTAPPAWKPVFSNFTDNATSSSSASGKPGGVASIFDVQLETCTPFLEMPKDFLADAAYWEKECKSIPVGATYIKMTMGTATDYYRPVYNTTMCEMLTSGKKHFWSSDRADWTRPNASNTGLGGSEDGWPSKNKPSDQRSSLSFWGDNGAQKGGCCNADYTSAATGWSKSYTMEYCGLPKALAPVCTPLTTVAGSFSADKAFWAQLCKQIPMTASFVKVAMGDFVDYFKPPTGKSYCDMLTASDMHKWSKDGYTWLKPKKYNAGSGLGGSALQGVNTSDARANVSFWGSTQALETGGCCYDSVADKAAGFGKSFTMSHCEVATTPPLAQFVTMLHQDESSIQKLEQNLDGMHTRILAAETVNIFAAGNVSLANTGMYKLAMKAKNEADEMKFINSQAALLQSSLDGSENSFDGAAKAVRKSAKKAAATAAIAKKTASPKGLQAQDDLNTAVWKLMDPANKDNLAATEKRVSAMEKETAAFRKELGNQVKTVMVTKLRRAGGRLRRAIHRLGAAKRKGAGRLGLVESDAPLGADLGFDED